MSFYWTPHCVSCDEAGPSIRSGSSGVLKFGADHSTSTDPLRFWLDAHEYHDVRLLSEGASPP